MLSVSQAVERILARTTTTKLETIPAIEAHGRVLGADAIAARVLPPFDNSAMDGFAVRSGELPGSLPIAGVIAAGDPPGTELAPGTVLRIMTGSPMPSGADAIVMRENVQDDGKTATFKDPAPVGRHIRRRGEDVDLGDVVVSAGCRLGPGELGALTSVGLSNLEVRCRPTVGILSTGDELVPVGTVPTEGQIINSNALTLAAQVEEAGGVPIPLGIAADNLEAVIEAIRAGLEHDVLITSGGVSVGDFDHVRPALDALDVEIDFWKIAVKPGKPVVFGVAQSGTLVFGLPGNPVSSLVSFELFARPALLALQGAKNCSRARVPVELDTAFEKTPGRTNYLRARIARRGGVLVATPHTKQGSGMLSSMVGVDALVEIDADVTSVPAGTTVSALLLRAV